MRICCIPLRFAAGYIAPVYFFVIERDGNCPSSRVPDLSLVKYYAFPLRSCRGSASRRVLFCVALVSRHRAWRQPGFESWDEDLTLPTADSQPCNLPKVDAQLRSRRIEECRSLTRFVSLGVRRLTIAHAACLRTNPRSGNQNFGLSPQRPRCEARPF